MIAKKVLLMELKTVVSAVGNLFNDAQYFVPKYQRAYAWNKDPVSDFISDIDTCYSARKDNLANTVDHFFGGVLSVKHGIEGVHNKFKYEIIDGQQRLVTVSFLILNVIRKYKEIVDTTDDGTQTIINARILLFQQKYFELEFEVNRRLTKHSVLTLSDADDSYYKKFIRSETPTEERDSHKLLSNACKVTGKYIDNIIDDLTSLDDKIDALDHLNSVLENDFTVLHIVVDSRPNAYRLFQVINDRGLTLSTGDLLRASTLEKVDNYENTLNTIAGFWDELLSDNRSKTDNILNWIYESHVGSRAKQSAFYDKFLLQFYPECNTPTLTAPEGERLRAKVKSTLTDARYCIQLLEGEWPYQKRLPVTGWDTNRLELLLLNLQHTLSIPLLLAARLLPQKKFSTIVQVIEKTFFRYKLICNQHVTPLNTIYMQEAKAIRADPVGYDVSSLKTKVEQLIISKASDEFFKTNLRELRYKKNGPDNKIIKYFLLSCEYFYEWHKAGATGDPTCLDKSRIYDFIGTSIEHIYPRNADTALIDTDLEPLKNSLSNLTLLDPGQNTTAGNDSFLVKKVVYQASSFQITKDLCAKTAWTKIETDEHEKNLMELALAIF
jgi:hypothetical protein